MVRVKVHLVGRDGIGWALDTEFALAKQALQRFADVVEAPQQADVLHTVWPEATHLAFDPEEGLGGLPVVAALNNDPFHIAHQPGFLDFAKRHYRLLAQSTLAQRRFRHLGLDAAYVPTVADLASYRPMTRDDPALDALASQWGIPRDKYLVGLLQRDGSGADVRKFRAQKGPDVFLAVMREVVRRAGRERVHVLLGGPRRHWLRSRLEEHRIPFTFVGEVLEGEDNHVNILDAPTMNLLYNLLDLYVIPTRWDGGPRGVVDIVACKRKVVSVPTGSTPDLLEPACVADDIIELAARIVQDLRHDLLAPTVDAQHARLLREHTVEAVSRRLEAVYAELPGIGRRPPRRVLRPLAHRSLPRRALGRALRTVRAWRPSPRRRVALWSSAPEAVEALPPAVQAALAARADVVPGPAESASHIVDAGPGQAEALRDALTRHGQRVVVRVPSTRSSWASLAMAAGQTRDVALAFPHGDALGDFVAAFPGAYRRAVVPCAFTPRATARREGLVLATDPGLVEGLTAAGLHSLVLPTRDRRDVLATSLAGAEVLVAGPEVPSELLHLALACGTIVVHDAAAPWDESSVNGRLTYERAKEAPALARRALEHAEAYRAIIPPTEPSEAVQGLLACLGLAPPPS